MALEARRVRAVCFDVDGTLRDTDDQFVQRLSRLVQPAAFLLPGHDVRTSTRRMVMWIENPGSYLMGLSDRLNLDLYLARLSDGFHSRKETRDLRRFWIIEGVKEMLRRLYGQYPLAIVSARSERSTLDFLEQFELTRFFQAIATGQTCRHTKPYPDPVLWAAGQMGVPASACLMVGDTTADIRAGKAAGAQTVGVLCGFGEQRELEKAGADMILPRTPDLQELLPI
jgi:phosphoglycolate phosphatase-like HAD superfamily hydrolase